VNADTCKDFLNALELYHDRKFTSIARDAYWAELKDYSDERIVLGLQASYGKFPPGRVPSINDIKALLSDIHETVQAKKRGVEISNRYPFSHRPKMAKESFGLLNRLFFQEGGPERITARQCVDKMIEMEEKYPGIGWKQGAEQLRTWIDRKEQRERDAVDKELQEIELRAQEELAKEKGAE